MVENSKSQHILDQSWPDFLNDILSGERKGVDEFARFAYKVLQSRPPIILKSLSYDLRSEIIQLTILHFIDDQCRILKKYTDQGRPFKSWFYQVAYRKALDIVREKQRTDARFMTSQKDEEGAFSVFDILEGSSGHPDDEMNTKDILEIIAEVMKRMKIKCQLLILGSISGFQPKQLAVLLGLGPGGNVTASNDLRACRKRLKELIAREGINLREDIA